MIPASTLPPQPTSDWRLAWRQSLTDPRQLLARLGLAGHAGQLLAPADTGFPLRVPESYLQRMRPGDPDDPLLRQVLPAAAELEAVPGYRDDAVGDLAASRAPGVIHKYHGRVLLIATGACAINCRYCFRRHFPYARELAARDRWRAALDYIAGDPSVHEVILSGGDPLSLDTGKLAEFTDALAGISHVRSLRLHSRLPIVLPERVDQALLAWMRGLPWPLTVVVHANHGNEIDATTATALRTLRDNGALVLNQSVLLAGVNDDVAALETLSWRLHQSATVPYYLHLLDQVAGAAHFHVDASRARRIHVQLRARLPGYLLPRLVREIAGEPAKTPL